MHDNLLYAVTTKINENSNFKCSKVSDKLYEQFEELNLDLDTKRLFQWHWFAEDVEVGPTIYSARRILEAEKENNYLKSGIIEIGYCPNGDEVFLRVKDSAILYWSHEDAENGEWNIKEESALFIAYSRVEYLLVNICGDNFIPWDSYSAREYFDLYQGK
jgi:hypothetical protein